LEICRIIYDSAGLQGEGRKRFFDIPESKISIIFERFLRNYLSEALSKEGLQVRKSFVSDWTEPADLLWGTSEHIPSISPDIVIWRGDQPLFVIDAKFYAEPVYAIERQYYGESDEDAPIRYKTHSGNLYQLISYTNYYNCDGLLIYAQTESGHFQELVRVKPRYYPPERSPRRFGFFTLDLSGNLEVFKKRMEDFTRTVLKLAHDKVS
jgi:5-methylcytosine-specific restriction endonuclease McrBC regulatory subunit McrC